MIRKPARKTRAAKRGIVGLGLTYSYLTPSKTGKQKLLDNFTRREIAQLRRIEKDEISNTILYPLPPDILNHMWQFDFDFNTLSTDGKRLFCCPTARALLVTCKHLYNSYYSEFLESLLPRLEFYIKSKKLQIGQLREWIKNTEGEIFKQYSSATPITYNDPFGVNVALEESEAMCTTVCDKVCEPYKMKIEEYSTQLTGAIDCLAKCGLKWRLFSNQKVISAFMSISNIPSLFKSIAHSFKSVFYMFPLETPSYWINERFPEIHAYHGIPNSCSTLFSNSNWQFDHVLNIARSTFGPNYHEAIATFFLNIATINNMNDDTFYLWFSPAMSTSEIILSKSVAGRWYVVASRSTVLPKQWNDPYRSNGGETIAFILYLMKKMPTMMEIQDVYNNYPPTIEYDIYY